MVGQDGSNLGPFQVYGDGLIHGVQDLDHNSGIHGFGFWVQHCVLMATTLYGLHTGWFGKTKLYGFLVAPVICFFLAMVLVTSKCLVTFFVVVTCLKQHLSLKIWNIQKTFSTCFPCTKTQCTKSTCFNIALGASYSTECFLVLTSYTWNMLIASIYHAILLCAIEKLYHIYMTKSTTHPWILKSKKKLVFKNHEKSSCRPIFSWSQM